MDKVALLSGKDRQELFRETAANRGMTETIAEKDFWVVFILYKIFSDKRLNKILILKGGTSLSKVFNLIGRFSEDIDLILDWRELTKEDPFKERTSKAQQTKFNEKLNEDAKAYINDILLPIISEIADPFSCKCAIDSKDGFNINITYPASFRDAYIMPQILLEIGPLAQSAPSESYPIKSYAAEEFPDIFEKKACNVTAIMAERTFWEKATILHQEANRPTNKSLPSRYSRHYYDLAVMAQSSAKNKALKNLGLLKEVVDFKNKFYPSSWARYDEAKPGSMKLLPQNNRIKELEKDYKAMGKMIFGNELSFTEILKRLKALEEEINARRSG